ncbi:MAG: hypothetical protein PUC00_05470 [Clostridiales bacterium]|nr:hypothetical protein [Clostridiales bacterium]
MKLKAYQIATWCDKAIHGRHRWLYLAGSAALLLLSPLCKLFWPVASVLLMCGAVLTMYLLHREHAFGKAYQRTPRPTDAQCETVLIDASLIGHGVRLRAAAQPVDVADGLSLRLGSGALLLGSAMVLTAESLPQAERAALLSAVKALNIKPSRLILHNPVLHRMRSGGVNVVTVRDGLSNRNYYLGAPEDVMSQCGMIWEGNPRTMTEHDHARIADAASYIAQGECHVLAWATALENEAPIFLGLGGLGEEVHLQALQDAATLRGMGLTLMLDAGQESDADLATLRALMALPEHHARADLHLTPNAVTTDIPLGITRQVGDSLVEPVALLKNRFSLIENTLRRFVQLLALPMAIAILASSGPVAPSLVFLLLPAAIWLGVDLTAPRLRCTTFLLCCALALLTRAFMHTQTAAVSALVAHLMSIAVGYCAMRRLCGEGFHFSFQLRNPALWLTLAVVLILLLLVVLLLLRGMAGLVPLGYGVLISAVMALLLLLEQRLFP